jgi:hypothetical protein
MQLRAAPQGLRMKAFQGTKVVVAAPSALRAAPRAKPATPIETVCGATPKGLPVSVSTYDDEMKEKSRSFRRTVSAAARAPKSKRGGGMSSYARFQ